MKDEKHTVYGTASLVCGIVGLVLFIMPYFGIILNILAMVFYGLQKKRQPMTRATAGLVLGIVGACINLVMLILVLAVLAISPSLVL
jgi:hypothetical protein